NAHFLIVKVLTRRERAFHKQRGVDGGRFAFPGTLPRFRIDEMVEPAVFMGDMIERALRGRQRALQRLARGHPAARISHAPTRESETGRRDAGGKRALAAIRRRAIASKSALQVSLLEKIEHRPLLNILHEGRIRTSTSIRF